MATYTERVAALEQRHTEERARLDRESAILALISDDLQTFDFMIHPTRLYDRIGSIHLSHCRYESLRKGPDPTAADVLRFVDAFPPCDVAVYRDTFVGIRTLTNAWEELEKAEAKGRSARIEPIAPFWLNFEAASYSSQLEIEWLSRTSIGVIEIRIAFPIWGELAQKIGTVQIKREDRTQGRYGESRITSTALNVVDSCRVIGDSKAELINRANSEDGKEPGVRTLYYASHNGECGHVTIEDLFRAAGVL